MYRNRTAYYTNDYRFAHYYLTISYIYVYIHTHMNFHICTLSVHLYIMSYVSLFLYTCTWLYCRAYTYIYMYTYIYIHIYIHIHIHIPIFYNCFVHAQDRYVQRRSPRHQLYKVSGMSRNPTPANNVAAGCTTKMTSIAFTMFPHTSVYMNAVQAIFFIVATASFSISPIHGEEICQDLCHAKFVAIAAGH